MYNYCTIAVAVGFLKQLFINQSKEPKGHSTHTEIQDPFLAEKCNTLNVLSFAVSVACTSYKTGRKEIFGVFSCSVSDYGSVTEGHSLSSDD